MLNRITLNIAATTWLKCTFIRQRLLIKSPFYLAFTDNCKQILCQCELIDVESCLPSLQELSATIAQVHKKEKSKSFYYFLPFFGLRLWVGVKKYTEIEEEKYSYMHIEFMYAHLRKQRQRQM